MNNKAGSAGRIRTYDLLVGLHASPIEGKRYILTMSTEYLIVSRINSIPLFNH